MYNNDVHEEDSCTCTCTCSFTYFPLPVVLVHSQHGNVATSGAVVANFKLADYSSDKLVITFCLQGRKFKEEGRGGEGRGS